MIQRLNYNQEFLIKMYSSSTKKSLDNIAHKVLCSFFNLLCHELLMLAALASGD